MKSKALKRQWGMALAGFLIMVLLLLAICLGSFWSKQHMVSAETLSVTQADDIAVETPDISFVQENTTSRSPDESAEKSLSEALPSSSNQSTATVSPPQNGVVQGPDGKWALYKAGKVDTSYTGIAKNQFGWWRVKDGYVDFTANGIYKNEYGWWKTTNGKVTFDETGISQNEFGWWRVENSKVDFKANGIYRNEYGWWKTTNGKVLFKENGLFKNEYGWWKVKNSKVDFSYNGLAQNSHGRWYINKGKVDFQYDGEAKYKGITYTCTDGKVTGGTNSAETNAVKVLNNVGWDFKKAYYWTIDNITYNKTVVPVDGSYGLVNYANHGFVQKSGNCYTFSCCVYYLGRMANEEIHIMKGTVPYRSGGRGVHSWNEITRNGKSYVLDAQYEQQWRNQGRQPYSGWLFTYGTKGSLVYQIDHQMD